MSIHNAPAGPAQSPAEELVRYSVEDRIAQIVLDRPDKLNAVSNAMLAAIRAALERFDDDAAADVAVVRGNGRAFCAGADIHERHLAQALAHDSPGAEPGGREMKTHELLFRFTHWKPVIAAVHGHALGAGLVLALSSDLTVAAESASFQVTEVTRGMSGNAIWALLRRRTSEAFATDVTLTARRWSGAEAYASGMVNRLCTDSELIPEATGLARAVAANPPLAVREAVRLRRLELERLHAESRAVLPRYLRQSAAFLEAAQSFVPRASPPRQRGTLMHTVRAGDSALTSLLVVDLSTGVAAGFAGRLLADLGADVVIVEPPGGHPLRTLGSERHDATWTYITHGKRNVILDLFAAEDRSLLAQLLSRAAVVLVDDETAVVTIEKIAPAAHPVVVAVTPYGLDSPRRAEATTAGVLFHESGNSMVDLRADDPASPPIAPVGHVSAFDAAAIAVVAALGELLDRDAATARTVVDVSIKEAGSCLTRQDLALYPNDGIEVCAHDGATAGPYGTLLFACADGDVMAHIGPKEWQIWSDVIARPDLADSLFVERDRRTPDTLEASTALAQWSSTRTRDEIEAIASAAGVNAAGVLDPREVLTDRQLTHRQFFDRTFGQPIARAVPFIARSAASDHHQEAQ